MMFLLSVLNLAYVIDPKTTPIADVAENSTPEEKEKIVQLKKKRDEDTFACRGHISTLYPTDSMISTCQFNYHWRFGNLLKKSTIPNDKEQISLL